MRLRGQDLGETFRAGAYSPLFQQKLHLQLLHALQGEEERQLGAGSCPRSLCEPVPAFPQSCLANMELGQLLLALIVPSASCCLQVFDNKTSPTTQGRVNVRRLPQVSACKLFCLRIFSFRLLPALLRCCSPAFPQGCAWGKGEL